MKFKVIFTVVFSILMSSLFAQSFPPRAMEIPTKYITPLEGVDYGIVENRRPGSAWIVFSDRANNTSYTNEKGKEEFKPLQFMDRFFVAEENDKRIHIIKDPAFQSGQFSSNAVDYGWVDKEKMLLWDHCLVTKEGKINKKGMVMNTLESLQAEKIKEGEGDRVVYCLDPDLKILSNNMSRIYEVLYIYKVSEDGMSFLLGKNYNTDKVHAKEELFGWVQSTKITVWDHRIAIEPNWEMKAVDERKAENTPAKFFVDAPRASKYIECGSMASKFILWDADTYEKRPIGEWRRFPLLQYDKETGIIKAGVMGEIRSVMETKDTISSIGFAEIQQRYNSMREKSRNINIVFVVDGTLSMDPYFKPISQAIRTSMERLKNQYTKNDLKFGAVIYTDYAEGDNLKRVKRLNSNYQDVANWIGNMSVVHKYDADAPEAVYYGLMTSLRATGLDKDETNIIILVGDAGNHHRKDASQVDKNALVKLLFEYNCNMLAIQVHHEGHSSYAEFEPQMKEIILSTAMYKYNQNKAIAEQVSDNAEFELGVPKFVPYKGNAFILDTTILIGTVIPCEKGNTIPTQRLMTEIDQTIEFSSLLMDRQLNMMEKMISEGHSFDEAIYSNPDELSSSSASAGSSYTPAIIDYLRRIDMPPEKLKIILAENYQVYMPLYAPMNVNCLEEPLFKRVLFLTLREFGDLLNKFDDLADASTGSDQRTKMKEAWMELLQSHLGEAFSRTKAEGMTFEKMNEQVFGLPGTSNLLNYTLGQLTDPSIVTDTDFYDYVMLIKNKRIELAKIFNSKNFDYGFYSYDTQFFWISQDLLP